MTVTETCRVCASRLPSPLYRSGSSTSLTSLCTVQHQETVVFLCPECGHLQTPPLEDIDEYYRSTYRILLESEEEDQLYEIVGETKVFRAEHQASTVLQLLELPAEARVLDFGAAKGATMRRILASRPDLRASFFDVSTMYVEYWERLVGRDEYATFSTPPEWSQRFDAVLSFFALEHVAEPAQVVADMRELLRPGGSLYIVVPNFEVNIADMVVVDHVNHFSGPSLERLLVDGGFEQVVLNPTAHHGAWIAIARRSEGAEGSPVVSQSIEAVAARSREIAEYWGTVDDHLSAAEAEIHERPTAIYGAGFYGSLIHTRLTTTDHVVAFVDQNPFLQGREHLGRPVVAPPDLPPEVTHLLVGLNPLGAAEVIGAIDVWRDRSLDFHYL